MKLPRTIFAVLIAISLAMTPLVAVFASSANSGMAGMEDCDQIPQGDCQCCDTKNTCPPEFCPNKCFKVIGVLTQPRALPVLVSLHLQPSEPDRPPDWSYAPQPPPPRT